MIGLRVKDGEQRRHQGERGEELAGDENVDEDRGIPFRIERHHPVGRGEIHAEHVNDEARRAERCDALGGAGVSARARREQQCDRDAGRRSRRSSAR